MGNPVTFFEVVGRNPEALRRFYGDAFGWRMDPFPPIPDYSFVHPDSEGGAGGGVGPAYDGGPGHATFYVEVADLEEALGRVEGLGGRRTMGPVDLEGGLSIALFADPEGHIVGLFKS